VTIVVAVGISDWSVEEVFRTEYGVEIFTFRCLVTGQTTTGERWHRMDSVSVGGRAYADGNAAETALEEVKLAETLEIRKHLIREELALSVEFSFDFPDECTSEVEWHSWVLYDLRDFTVLHAADLNGALAPGIAYSERSSERCGMSTSKHTHLSTISHGAGTAVASPKKFEALRNEFLAPKGEKIEFGDFFRGAPREENRQVLVVNGLIWNGKDRHLDVYVISCKSAGSGPQFVSFVRTDVARWSDLGGILSRRSGAALWGSRATSGHIVWRRGSLWLSEGVEV
jgi:hypothetical protein